MTNITIAHQGRPFDPPVINTDFGPVIFAPDPAGSPFWLGQATPEQAQFLLAFGFYQEFKGAAFEPNIDYVAIPDKSWTCEGISAWALEFLGVTMAIGKKKDMLAALQIAIEEKKAGSTPAPAPEVAASEPASEPVAPASDPTPEPVPADSEPVPDPAPAVPPVEPATDFSPVQV